MEEKKFYNAANQEKTAYELTSKEFNALIANLRLFGDLPRTAITLSNDRKTGLRPRMAPVKEAVELLHEVLGDKNADEAEIAMTDLDVLRSDRAEIARAIQRPSESGLHKKVGNVVLGLPTIGAALNDIRVAVTTGRSDVVKLELMQNMVNQFYDDGVQRLMDTVQVNGQ